MRRRPEGADEQAQARLEAALLRDDLPGVEAALADGADANAPDAAGLPPLVRACQASGVPARRAARALLDAGADATWAERAHGFTVLHHAVAGACDAGMLELLLERGADPNATSRWGETALQRALRDLDVEKAAVLAPVTSDPDAKNAAGASARSLAQILVERATGVLDALDGSPPRDVPPRPDASPPRDAPAR